MKSTIHIFSSFQNRGRTKVHIVSEMERTCTENMNPKIYKHVLTGKFKTSKQRFALGPNLCCSKKYRYKVLSQSLEVTDNNLGQYVHLVLNNIPYVISCRYILFITPEANVYILLK